MAKATKSSNRDDEEFSVSSLLNPLRFLRQTVSLKKKRFQQGEYDLDLVYVTDQVIAMGYPSDCIQALYRNPRSDVKKFLTERHGESYKVYNLCEEPEYFYHKVEFDGRVANYGFADHCPPPMNLIARACVDAVEWIAKSPRNIVAVHCKAGKGRTGTMVCCLLIVLGLFNNAEDSLAFYGKKRSEDCQGVTIPSQTATVRLFAKLYNQLGGTFEQLRSEVYRAATEVQYAITPIFDYQHHPLGPMSLLLKNAIKKFQIKKITLGPFGSQGAAIAQQAGFEINFRLAYNLNGPSQELTTYRIKETRQIYRKAITDSKVDHFVDIYFTGPSPNFNMDALVTVRNANFKAQVWLRTSTLQSAVIHSPKSITPNTFSERKSLHSNIFVQASRDSIDSSATSTPKASESVNTTRSFGNIPILQEERAEEKEEGCSDGENSDDEEDSSEEEEKTQSLQSRKSIPQKPTTVMYVPTTAVRQDLSRAGLLELDSDFDLISVTRKHEIDKLGNKDKHHFKVAPHFSLVVFVKST